MKAKIISVGNARFVRIPKPLLKHFELATEVQLDVQKDHLAVRPSKPARRGWDAAFARMRANRDDKLLF